VAGATALRIEFKVVLGAPGPGTCGGFRRRAEEFARKFINGNPFRRLGVFGDWENPYLTLAPAYEADIIRVFATLVEKGLVYQSRKPVSWSFGARTAPAKAEVEYKEVADTAVYVKPIVEGRLAGKVRWSFGRRRPGPCRRTWGSPCLHASLTSARISFHADGRTENLVGAQSAPRRVRGRRRASPSHQARRFTNFLGKILPVPKPWHPFLERKSKVIMGDFVTEEQGTGAVHVAPGHGAVDYAAGQEHGLGLLSPVDDNGCYTEEVGVPELVGQHVLRANERVVEVLSEGGFLLGKERYLHSYPHCRRSKTPIIFRSVEQFFIRIDAFRQAALAEIDQVEWLPHWGRNRIYGTVEARPDWCISRQPDLGCAAPGLTSWTTRFYWMPGSPAKWRTSSRPMAATCGSSGTTPPGPRSSGCLKGRVAAWTRSMCGSIPDGATSRARPPCGVGGPGRILYLEATDQHRGWFQSSSC